MQTFKLSDFDPCAVEVSDEVVRKYSHHMEEKQRVRVIADGRTGVLQTISPGDHYWVKLDSNHTIRCRQFELEPEDFPHSAPAPAKTTTLTAAQFDGLQRKVSLGEIDELDAHRVKKALANPAVLDPFSPETDADRVLTAMCKKHLGQSAGADGNTFTKAAGSNTRFQIGDRIKDDWGNLGKITAINAGRAEIKYDSGIEGSVLIGRFKAA